MSENLEPEYITCPSCSGLGNHDNGEAIVDCPTCKRTGRITLDPNVTRVRDKLVIRAERGLRKYGVTTERGDLSELDWLRHAQEEALDLAVYLERLIQEKTK